VDWIGLAQHYSIYTLSLVGRSIDKFFRSHLVSGGSIKENSMASVRERTIPTERPPFVSEVSANFFADRRCHVVSVTNPYGRILGFLDRSR
jgi:hypothetical protein